MTFSVLEILKSLHAEHGKMEKGRRKMANVKGTKTTETFSGSTKMEISTGKRLKSCLE